MNEAQTTVLHAFLLSGKRKLFVADADKASVESYVASERQRVKDELAAFLAANGLGHHKWSLRPEEGGAIYVISSAVREIRPDLLIMGTHGRSALLKALIGSVAEEALRTLNVDILAVPPAR